MIFRTDIEFDYKWQNGCIDRLLNGKLFEIFPSKQELDPKDFFDYSNEYKIGFMKLYKKACFDKDLKDMLK